MELSPALAEADEVRRRHHHSGQAAVAGVLEEGFDTGFGAPADGDRRIGEP